MPLGISDRNSTMDSLCFQPQSAECPQGRETPLICFNVLLKVKCYQTSSPDITNDRIATASDWEEKLPPPKCGNKDYQQVWSTSFPHMLTYRKKKNKIRRH